MTLAAGTRLSPYEIALDLSKWAHTGGRAQYLSPGWLRIDPDLDPLGKEPEVPEAGRRGVVILERSALAQKPFDRPDSCAERA
jgi:hypothetical protein